MSRGVAWIAGAYLAVTVLAAAWLPLHLLSRLFQDDAFFYFSIARNIVDGKGSTFDGLHATNGYHPLWMLLMIGLDSVVPLRGAAGLRAVMVVNGILVATTLVVQARLLARACASAMTQVASVVLVIAMLGFANIGMESAVWMLSFVLFLGALRRLCPGPTRMREWALVGLAATASYLSRTDSIIFIGLMAGYATIAVMRRERARLTMLRSGLGVVVPVAAAGALQVLVNLKHFGEPNSISSALKVAGVNFKFQMLFPTEGRSLQPLIHIGSFFIVLLVALGLAVSLMRWRGREEREAEEARYWRRLLAAANIYTVVFLTTALLTLQEPPRTWYYTIAFLAIITGTAALLESPSGRRLSARLVVGGTTLLSTLSLLVLLLQYVKSPRENALSMSGWLRDNTSPDTVAFVTDGSGILNYFSERRVIDGDGLVGDFAFKRTVEARQLHRFLGENNVGIVIANVGSDARRRTRLKIYSASWIGMRSYVYAVAEPAKALATFADVGHFGFMAFRTKDLELPQPATGPRGP